MATRKKPEETLTESSERKNDYIEFKLPQFSQRNPRIIGFILLLALTFFAGFQTAKVTYWEQKEESIGKALATVNEGGAVPTPTPSFYKVDAGRLPLLGNKDAKVTIVEFSDLQCLFCRRFWKDTLPQLKKDYIDKGLVKLAFRHYPLPPELHPAARPLAEASECANEQGKFWEFHDKTQEDQAAQGEGTIPVPDEDIVRLASEIGLDLTQFNDCFTNKKYTKNIDQDMADGALVNVNSTPTFYINGQIVVGAVPYSTFKTIIDQQLKK